MKISSTLFEAFLKCPTKCFFLSHRETSSGNSYAEWQRAQSDSYRREGIKCLTVEASRDECVVGLNGEKNLKSASWRLAQDVVASVQEFESSIHMVERVPTEGRGRSSQVLPIQFIFRNKLSRDDKLLLAFNAFVLSKHIGREVRFGKIIHGNDRATTKVNTSGLANEVQKLIGKITALLSRKSPPDLILNRHCSECEFQVRCRQMAIEKDELSLLAGMTEKERKKLNAKGIFTITQLSYTFRPRRRRKAVADKREKYHHALKALAIRESKIHIVGSPELKIEGTPVYLDVESLPDRDFYYLIGIRIPSAQGTIQHSFWADNAADEKQIWTDFLGVLSEVERPVVMHYGSFETTFMNRMCERYGELPEGSGPAKAIASAINLVSVIFGQVYFPTHSNGLKDIAGYLGFRWSESAASGTQSIARRDEWESSKEPSVKQSLLTYNANDCEALDVLASNLLKLQQHASLGNDRLTESGVVDASRLKPDCFFDFKRTIFYLAEFDVINKAAYWDYQRERIYVKSKVGVNHLKRALRRSSNTKKALSPNKTIECAHAKSCPKCYSTTLSQYGKTNRTILDLKFFRHGIKRWITLYQAHRYQCQACGATFHPRDSFWTRSKYGIGISAYAIYQNIELRMPQRSIDRTINKLFGFNLPFGATSKIKTRVAKTYEETYKSLITNLCRGQLLHADETKISVRGNDGFVWVFASMEEVIYFYSETRQGDTVQNMLKDFKGVLVSDFYAAYDSIQCPQQKCLIHLIRDLNDEVLQHPYDEELKRLVKGFADLVKPMVESIDRHGLKSHFLKKHLSFVDRFYKHLGKLNLQSESASKCKQRFEKNRDTLFTFLKYDGVPWNNNNAEHAVKAFAMLRNVIQGVTSAKGLHDYLVLLSICETCKFKGVEFLDFLLSGEKDIDLFAQRKPRKRTGAVARTSEQHD